MLQQLRDQTQGTGFKVLVGTLILVLTLFGFGATAVFSGGDPEVAQVGDFEITQSMLATETERERIRVLSRMGPDFDPASIDRLELQNYVLQQVIGRQVLTEANDVLGVGVSQEQVNRELVNSPAYQVDGKFNEDLYRQSVQTLGYRPVDFLKVVGEDLSREQLRSALVDTASLPEWELAELIRVVNQRRDIAFLPLSIEDYSDPDAITDEAIALRYEEDQSAFMTELAVDVAYISLSVDALLESGEFSASDADIASLYEEDKAAALRDEQRAASHILIQINSDRDEAQAKELITEVQTRLNDGEDFAQLAKEVSEDAGSKAAGGALDAFSRGTYPADFEQALWALASPGDVSAPVLTEAGYHIIQLNDVVEADYPSLETQRDALIERVKRAQAAEQFAELALELERVAYEERYGLDGVASAAGLTVTKVERVSRGNTQDDTVLANSSVLDSLFSDDVLAGSNSEPIELGPDQVVFVRVDEQYAPEVKPLEDVAQEIRSMLTREAALAAIAQAKQNGLAQLQAGESVSEIARSLGGAVANKSWQTFTLAPRAGLPNVPQEILTYAFELPRPAKGEKSVGALDLLGGGAALVTVTRVLPGDITTTADAEVAQLRQALASRNARIGFESFFVAAEDTVGVTRPLASDE